MRKILLFAMLVYALSGCGSNSSTGAGAANTDSVAQKKDTYKLYSTKNIYNFLKLNTATGQVYQVQWSLDEDNEFTISINDSILTPSPSAGTFKLHSTKNMYQFLLLNTITGETWHVQWGMEDDTRWIRPINQ